MRCPPAGDRRSGEATFPEVHGVGFQACPFGEIAAGYDDAMFMSRQRTAHRLHGRGLDIFLLPLHLHRRVDARNAAGVQDAAHIKGSQYFFRGL